MTTPQFVTIVFLIGSICARLHPSFKDYTPGLRSLTEIFCFLAAMAVYALTTLLCYLFS